MSSYNDATSHVIRPNEHAVYIKFIGAGGYGEIHSIRNMQTQQCFARKTIRALAGNVTEEEIRNEARAIDKLCKTSHDNIIGVLGHDRLNPTSAIYFIDMELCNINLEEYIQGTKTGVRGLIDWQTACIEGQRQFLIFAIMQQLLSGLAFIHDHGEVHRDMALQNVLYSASSGWWKIADFGLTASATSKHLKSTTGKRGRACYRAPEIIRDNGAGYNKKVDIWSLGCILFELCVGKKAFKDDFDTFQFATMTKPLVIEFADSFEQTAAEKYEPLIRQMLDPEHEKRPSVNELCKLYTGFLSLVTPHNQNQIQTHLNNDLFLIQQEYLLGTDVLSEDAFHSLRWDKGLPGSNLVTLTEDRHLQRWKRLVEARKIILGEEHRNTIWSLICLAWTRISIGDSDNAAIDFQDAFERIVRSEGIERKYAVFMFYGLAWAHTDAEKIRPATELFEDILDNRSSQGETPTQRFLLATRSALARNHLLWRPHEDTIPMLTSILNEQKTALGDDHPDTLETLSFLATAYLLHHNSDATVQGNKLFKEAFSVPTRLFEIEHPVLLTLCGLSWTLVRHKQQRVAQRLFDQLEQAQNGLLVGEYPSTVRSLEALAPMLNRGVCWRQSPNSQKTSGNNPYGLSGVRKCEECRKAKRQARSRLYPYLTVVPMDN